MIKWYKDADTGELMPLPDDTDAKQNMPKYLEPLPVIVSDNSDANTIILELKTQLEEERKLRISLEKEKPLENINEDVKSNNVIEVMAEPEKYSENILFKNDHVHSYTGEIQRQIYDQKIKALQTLGDSGWLKIFT